MRLKSGRRVGKAKSLCGVTNSRMMEMGSLGKDVDPNTEIHDYTSPHGTELINDIVPVHGKTALVWQSNFITASLGRRDS